MRLRESSKKPLLSVVTITDRDFEVCRKAIDFLKAQTALGDLELVIVAPSLDALGLEVEEVECFPSLQIVVVGAIESTGHAMAAGVRAARADWVAYCEEHSFPDPGWAAALIEAQADTWAAVGCSIANANPGTLVSWASLLGEFGPVAAPVRSGEVKFLGGHHASYRKELLLPFGELLDSLLEFEVALHQALLAGGHRLYLTGDAVSSHLNISRLGPFIKSDYLGQRGFGAMRWRGQGWGLSRRLVYAAGTPLIPLLRLARSVKHVWRCGRGRIPWIFPVMAVAMIAGAVGEAAGYLFGAGQASAGRVDIELDRPSFISASDREII
jgi:hypothetical protein